MSLIKVITIIQFNLCTKYSNCYFIGIIPEFSNLDPHVIANLLKQYLRDLPEPLLTFELYDCFIAATGKIIINKGY